MKELRVDVSKLSAEEAAIWREEEKDVWKLNHTLPYSVEYNTLLDKLFPDKGENVNIRTPIAGVHLNKVKLGNNVTIMNGSLMMACGSITIEDNTMLAANVQLISNNHDLDKQRCFSIRPAHDNEKNTFERQNDIYVFCLLLGETREEANPLNLNNWEFYIVPTTLINEKCKTNKSISLNRIKNLGITATKYENIKSQIDSLII